MSRRHAACSKVVQCVKSLPMSLCNARQGNGKPAH